MLRIPKFFNQIPVILPTQHPLSPNQVAFVPTGFPTLRSLLPIDPIFLTVFRIVPFWKKYSFIKVQNFRSIYIIIIYHYLHYYEQIIISNTYLKCSTSFAHLSAFRLDLNSLRRISSSFFCHSITLKWLYIYCLYTL